MPTTTTKTDKLHLRISAQAKQRLTAAARLSQRSLSDFVLESALERADETLADRRDFVLPPDKWEEFLAALDAPPKPLARRLVKLLTEPSVFER